jgi:anti-anti-sigma factor
VTSSESGYQLEATDQYTVVTLAAKLSNEQWGDIHEVGNKLVKRLKGLKTQKLLVDLSEMEYIGSSTVALVVRLWKTVQEQEGALAVISKHPVVVEVLQISGLSKVWTVVDSRDEALTELGITKTPGLGVLVYIQLLTIATAVAGLVIQFNSAWFVLGEVKLGLLFGGAGLGLLLGVVNTLRGTGICRMVSLLALLASLVIGIVGIAAMTTSM